MKLIDLEYGRRLEVAPGVSIRAKKKLGQVVSVAVDAPKRVKVRRGEDRRRS